MPGRRPTVSAGNCPKCGSLDTYRQAGGVNAGKVFCRPCARNARRRQRQRAWREQTDAQTRTSTIHAYGGYERQDEPEWRADTGPQDWEPPRAPLPTAHQRNETLTRLTNGETRQFLRDADISQTRLAQQTGTSQSTVARWLAGDTRPHGMTLIRVTNYLAHEQRRYDDDLYRLDLHGIDPTPQNLRRWQRDIETNYLPECGAFGGEGPDCPICIAWAAERDPHLLEALEITPTA